MDEFIYKASDSSDMTKEDLIDWLSVFKDQNPHYRSWSFDDITGGASSFFEVKDYIDMKSFYEKHLKQ